MGEQSPGSKAAVRRQRQLTATATAAVNLHAATTAAPIGFCKYGNCAHCPVRGTAAVCIVSAATTAAATTTATAISWASVYIWPG
jgi:hypothetical protein